MSVVCFIVFDFVIVEYEKSQQNRCLADFFGRIVTMPYRVRSRDMRQYVFLQSLSEYLADDIRGDVSALAEHHFPSGKASDYFVN